jgi:hypothetical protein
MWMFISTGETITFSSARGLLAEQIVDGCMHLLFVTLIRYASCCLDNPIKRLCLMVQDSNARIENVESPNFPPFPYLLLLSLFFLHLRAGSRSGQLIHPSMFIPRGAAHFGRGNFKCSCQAAALAAPPGSRAAAADSWQEFAYFPYKHKNHPDLYVVETRKV